MRIGIPHETHEKDYVVVLMLTKNEDDSLRRAEKAGVQIADRLISINGKAVVPATAEASLRDAKYPLTLEFLRAKVSAWKKVKSLRQSQGAFKEFDPDGDGKAALAADRASGAAWGGAAK